jgi:hypothetical protein
VEATFYDHCDGQRRVAAPLRNEIRAAVRKCTVTPVRNAAGALRRDILDRLFEAGWSSEVPIDPTSRISITSIKSRVGLCFQTGNMGRMYADLLKLQTLYLRESIDAGILLLPRKLVADELGSNIANYDRLTAELPIFQRTITTPLLIIGIEPE